MTKTGKSQTSFINEVSHIGKIRVQFNDKVYWLDEDWILEIQIGRDRKSSYKSIAFFSVKNWDGAIIHYNGINICYGTKKRLICNNLLKPVIDRQFSVK